MSDSRDSSDSCRGGNREKTPRGCRAYCFTCWDLDRDSLTHHFLTLGAKAYVMGYETCPKTGKRHIQGYVNFKNQLRGTTVKGKFNMHFEKAIGSPWQNFNYCSKENDYIAMGIEIEGVPQPLPEWLNKPLYDWQLDIENMLDTEPHDRTIHWIWEPEGNMGKTFLMKYMSWKYPSQVCACTAPKSADILTVCDKKYKMYIFGFARSQEDYCPWLALEQVKDGFITDAKLKKKARIVNCKPPHVICLANWPPDESKLSKDRWNIIQLRGRPPSGLTPYGALGPDGPAFPSTEDREGDLVVIEPEATLTENSWDVCSFI